MGRRRIDLDERRIVELRAKRYTWAEIATAMGGTASAWTVRNRWRALEGANLGSLNRGSALVSEVRSDDDHA